MTWYLIGHWLSFLLPTFYKKIRIHNVHLLFTKDPVVIAMNHPNAFTDPIAISYRTFPLRLYYMARGDAFKPGIVSWLLENIGIVPIFRIQDAGKEGLKKNDAAYRRVNRLLKRNGKVIVFAEGLCVQERRLRPLKKGVARMVFGAYEHLGHDRLKVIPVGVNYSKPDKFRSKILYNIGEPIAVRDYIEMFRANPARTQNIFLQDLEKAMLNEVIHIPRQDLDDTVHFAEKLIRPEIIKNNGMPAKDLRSEFTASRLLIDKLIRAEKENPSLFEEFRKNAPAYFAGLKQRRLKDWLFRPDRQKSNNPLNLLARLLVIALVSPVYTAGMAVNFPPLAITHLVTKKIVKVVEFYSSFALGVSMFVFPLFYILWFFIFYGYFHNLLMGLGCCIIAAFCGWACLYIHPFILQTLGLARFLRLHRETAPMKEMRARLVEILNNI